MDLEDFNDREWVVLALSGNQHAYTQLMYRHKTSLNAYIQRQFSLGDAVEDLVLIIFEKAFRNLDGYNPQFAFSTWLYSIADHTCIDYIRKQKTLSLAFRRLSDKSDLTIATSSDPESELITSQEAALLIHYINKLKPIYREPVRLRHLHHYAYEEIASELSLPVNTVKVRLHRAKEILSKWIAQS